MSKGTVGQWRSDVWIDGKLMEGAHSIRARCLIFRNFDKLLVNLRREDDVKDLGMSG